MTIDTQWNSQLRAQQLPVIQALCREFGVVRLDVFTLPPGDEPALLVTFPNDDNQPGARRLVEMEERLATIIGRTVTLFTVAALRNDYMRNEAWQTRSTLYEVSARYPFTS